MSFARAIVDWQKVHGRHDLPWQNTTDAYRIWLSEIMLQQTQVVTVKEYYAKFLTHFPSVIDLAHAHADEVMALWAGLGYYSRARNLHECAQAVVRDWGGQFPATAAQLQTLKGIGPSTASAIAVFAYGERAAILDGNVKRILCRYFGIDAPAGAAADKLLWPIAQQEIMRLNTVADYRAYTQGLMDLGASLCARRKPDCGVCPLQQNCFAQQNQQTEQLPRAKAVTAVREMSMAFYIYRHNHQVWLEKRPNQGIWAGLYAFPQEVRLNGAPSAVLPVVKHRLTHRLLTLHAQVFELDATNVAQLASQGRNGVWLSKNNAQQTGMPKPIADWVWALLA